MFSINTPFLDYRMDTEMTRLVSPSLEFKLSKHILAITCTKYNTGLILICSFFMKMCMIIRFSEKKKQKKKNTVLVCSIYQSPWYKYYPHGWFQAANVMSLNLEWGRQVHKTEIGYVLAPARHCLLRSDFIWKTSVFWNEINIIDKNQVQNKLTFSMWASHSTNGSQFLTP